jgi:hypothetical protein|tara:strand:+ start:627 stop:866 length:240 start_codon:yes stop_codon:yes gene_type:complete
MDYTINDIDKILEFKTWSDRRKIDELLRMDCEMYTNLGIDSTKKEKSEVTKNSRRIYKAIKTIDQKMGQTFLLAMDSTS